MSFIAGGYTVTLGGSTVGQIQDGIMLEQTLNGEPVRGDTFGDTIQDFVFRGGDVFMNMVLLEYDATSAKTAFWPWSTTWGRITSGIVGKLGTAMAAALVLTAVAGTSAATAPATLTANKAILAPGFPVQMLFAPRLRSIPIRLQLLPYNATNDQFFVLT